MPTDDDLIGTAEAAAILDRPVATINRMALDGRLPIAVQMPGRTGARLYRRSDVEALRRVEAERLTAMLQRLGTEAAAS